MTAMNLHEDGGFNRFFCSSRTRLEKAFSRIYNSHIEPNLGVYLALVSQFFNSLMIMFAKLILSDPTTDDQLHPLQILFIRMIFTYAGCIFYFVWYSPDPDFPFGPKGIRFLLLARGVGGFFGVGFQYWSLLYLDVSDTICITFLSPTITSLMASILLGERFTKVEMIGGIAAFFGVILIAKPAFIFGDDDQFATAERLIGSTFAFCSTFGTAIAMCSIRKIGFRAHPLFMVSVYALVTIFISFFGILILPGISFKWPANIHQWILLTSIGIAGFFMQFLLTAGMQRERAARAIAMNYTQLIYASIFDYIVYNRIPQGWSALGEIIIVAAVFSIVIFKTSNNSVVQRSEGMLNVEEDQLPEEFDLTDDLSSEPYKDSNKTKI
ncbi:hypothetical protein DAMA08_045920 [Martiniozyma asiatica (nom. inval.)]|nr:hypothetical protein DAMA08_045920 [Martiniozyma asiatica]